MYKRAKQPSDLMNTNLTSEDLEDTFGWGIDGEFFMTENMELVILNGFDYGYYGWDMDFRYPTKSELLAFIEKINKGELTYSKLTDNCLKEILFEAEAQLEDAE